MTVPQVSVVIATRNRAGLLAETLDALARQSWPVDRFEIVVSDNGSTDDTRSIVRRRAAASGPAVRYLYVPEPGKSSAVNEALSRARGDLLAFTDDDVIPDAAWLRHLCDAFTPHVAFVAGRILPRWEAEPPSWLSPALHGVLAVRDNGVERHAIDRDDARVMPIGANMAVRASVVHRIGGLRSDLGKLAGTLRTGEDHEFFLRMLRAGFRGLYEPAAIVEHWVPKDRLKRSYFRRWLHQNGRDVARLEASYPSQTTMLLGVPRYRWRECARDAARAARAMATGDRRNRVASTMRMLWFAGYLQERWTPDVVHCPMRLAEEYSGLGQRGAGESWEPWEP